MYKAPEGKVEVQASRRENPVQRKEFNVLLLRTRRLPPDLQRTDHDHRQRLHPVHTRAVLPFILALQAPKIDSGAMALLKKNRDAMFALRGYRARCQMVTKVFNADKESGPARMSYQFSVLTAAKPNLVRYEMWEVGNSKSVDWKPKASPDFAVVADGKKRWMQAHQNYSVLEETDPRTIETANEPWGGFYSVDDTLYERARSSLQKQDDVVIRLGKRERLDGTLCDAIEIRIKEQHGKKSIETRTVVLLRPDGLVRRQTTTTIRNGAVFINTADLLHIEKNPNLRRQSYAYIPPKGAKLFAAPNLDPEATSQPTLLANGSAAPDFVAKDQNGKEIRLSDLKGKVVVLDFWASWCAPCVASMPHTQDVAAKLQKEGLPVVVLAVDDAEKASAFDAWVKKNGAEYPALRFAYSPLEVQVSSKLFKATGIPTQYVIDETGTIRASFIGFSGETNTLEKALRAAAQKG